MGINYVINGNQIFAIEGGGAFSTGDILGQLKFRIKQGSEGAALAIDDIGVEEASRNKGIGTGLTLKAIDHARKKSCRYVVALAQPEYLKILKSMGFEIDGFLARLNL